MNTCKTDRRTTSARHSPLPTTVQAAHRDAGVLRRPRGSPAPASEAPFAADRSEIQETTTGGETQGTSVQAQLYSYVRLWTLVLAAAAARSESRTRANRTMVVRRPSSMRRSIHRFTTAAILLLVACWSYLPTTHAVVGPPILKTITGKSGYKCVDSNGCLIR